VVEACPLPDGALSQVYAKNGSYTDCFTTSLDRAVTFEQYVTAFYTTWVFKLERLILKWAVAKPSTDEQAAQLGAGTIDGFAAWHVEQRAPNQLLLCDFMGRTRSWLMVEPASAEGRAATRLYFGSAVTAGRETRFSALIAFHKLYSRLLLSAARSRLERTSGTLAR
jgi:hypothetical protein